MREEREIEEYHGEDASKQRGANFRSFLSTLAAPEPVTLAQHLSLLSAPSSPSPRLPSLSLRASLSHRRLTPTPADFRKVQPSRASHSLACLTFELLASWVMLLRDGKF